MDSNRIAYTKELSLNGFFLPIINDTNKIMIVGGYAISYKNGDYGKLDGRNHITKLGNGIGDFIKLLKNKSVITYSI